MKTGMAQMQSYGDWEWNQRPVDAWKGLTHAKAAPQPLDDAFLQHAMPHPDAEDPVDMLDQGKVTALDHIHFVVLSAIEGDLFGYK